MTDCSQFLPYGRQSINDEDVAAVVAVLRGDFLTQGPAIDRFEAALAKSVGCKHVIVMNSGTAALHLGYAGLGVGPGEAVLVPAITFAATANAAVYCGATPVFCDVDPHSGLMTAETLERGIADAKAKGLKPKIAAPVHYAGLPVDMNAITEVASKNNMTVFEDACHALGGDYCSSKGNWRKVGNWDGESGGAAFSFHPVKHVATGEGGAIATNRDDVAHKARALRTHGITKAANEFKLSDLAFDSHSDQPNPWYYEMQELGWNYRMSDVCAALGESQMKRLAHSVQKRREIAGWYDKLLTKSIVKKPVYEHASAKHAWHLYPLHIDFTRLSVTRAAVMNALRAQGIGTQVHYIPVPALPFYKQQGYATPEGAWSFYQRELSLPMYPDLTYGDIEKICAVLMHELEK